MRKKVQQNTTKQGDGPNNGQKWSEKKTCPKMIKNHLKTLPRFIRGNFSTNEVIFEPKIENFFFPNFSNLRVFRDPPSQFFFDQKYKKKTLSWVFKCIFSIMIFFFFTCFPLRRFQRTSRQFFSLDAEARAAWSIGVRVK